MYHFIGIGGIGMSALARILLKKGKKVQGSDLNSSYITEQLKEDGAEIFARQDHSNITPSTIIVYNSMINEDNPEYKAAVQQNLPILHRSDLLAQLMEGTKSLSVTGTHGKTTTSALLAHLLVKADLDPSYAIGGTVVSLKSNGGHGEGEYFVAEADESDGTFLKYSPFGAIITNIENDHLNYWKTVEQLKKGFEEFAGKVASRDHLFIDENLNLPGITYGFSSKADLRIEGWWQDGWQIRFDLSYQGKKYEDIEVPLLGKHNVANSSAVFGMGLALGLDEKVIREALRSFKGVKRRMEKKGEKRGMIVYDDYAHHPTKIAAALKSLRHAIGEKRLVVAFQPHRYTRTQDCLNEYLRAFEDADEVVFCEIYPAGEKPIPGVTGKGLFEAVKNASAANCHFADNMVEFLAKFLRPHDVLITMGAGDITAVGPAVLEKNIAPFSMALLAGGKSAEYEVALSSAAVTRKALNPEYYSVKNFEVSKDGQWLMEGKKLTLPEVVSALTQCEICLPIMHGPFSEDGMLQGFFETIGLPYAGCDYRTCALAMDKAWTKRLVATFGIVIADFVEFEAYEWEQDREKCIKQIMTHLPFPLFVKPVHLGSTIGVGRVTSRETLEKAIDEACALDFKFLVEEEIVGREVQFGYLGNHNVFVSDPGEVTRLGEVHTYEEKYGATATPTIPKIPLPLDVLTKGKQIAEKAYRVSGCTGIARIDFFLKDGRTWILNEINPMPGLTPTSAYPKIMAAEGISMPEVVDRLVVGALHRKRYQERRLKPPKALP